MKNEKFRQFADIFSQDGGLMHAWLLVPKANVEANNSENYNCIINADGTPSNKLRILIDKYREDAPIVDNLTVVTDEIDNNLFEINDLTQKEKYITTIVNEFCLVDIILKSAQENKIISHTKYGLFFNKDVTCDAALSTSEFYLSYIYDYLSCIINDGYLEFINNLFGICLKHGIDLEGLIKRYDLKLYYNYDERSIIDAIGGEKVYLAYKKSLHPGIPAELAKYILEGSIESFLECEQWLIENNYLSKSLVWQSERTKTILVEFILKLKEKRYFKRKIDDISDSKAYNKLLKVFFEHRYQLYGNKLDKQFQPRQIDKMQSSGKLDKCPMKHQE